MIPNMPNASFRAAVDSGTRKPSQSPRPDLHTQERSGLDGVSPYRDGFLPGVSPTWPTTLRRLFVTRLELAFWQETTESTPGILQKEVLTEDQLPEENL